jgi:Spy/CpxP family protein refolding chaperone
MNMCKSFILAALCAMLLGAPALVLASPRVASAASTGHHGGLRSMLRNLELTPQQEDQIKSLVQAYRQAHPRGSQPDPAARKQLRDQILSLLTPEQRAQLEQEMQQRRDNHGDQGQAPNPSPTPEP